MNIEYYEFFVVWWFGLDKFIFFDFYGLLIVIMFDFSLVFVYLGGGWCFIVRICVVGDVFVSVVFMLELDWIGFC